MGDYYELAAMLRMQLPILVSFCMLRCLIGTGTKLCVRRLVPESAHVKMKPVNEAAECILSLIHAMLLWVAHFYFLVHYDTWSKKMPEDVGVRMCREYAVPRVQGLFCAVGMLAMFTNSDPFTLSLSLTVFKAVADGSVFATALAVLTWRASCMNHTTTPVLFFAILFACSIFYGSLCYSDVAKDDRTQSAVLAMCFGALVLLYRATLSSTRMARSLWLRLWRSAAPRPTLLPKPHTS